MNFREFYKELKRRRVFKGVSLYVVACWVIIQVTSTIFPQLDWPDWTLKATLALCFIGLPIAILIAWLYDISPDGDDIKSRNLNKPGEKNLGDKVARIVLLTYTVVSIIGFGFLIKYLSSSADSIQIETDISRLATGKTTIAVLPFANLSEDKDQEYFSDGLTDEIRSMLSKIPSLRVISRTSCMFYKNKNIPLSEIANELGVSHVLEGSVRKSNDKLRINLNLTDTSSDELIWSLPNENHDISEIFELQEKIALEVLKGLQVEFLRPIRDISLEKYTNNVEVYSLYLKAQKLFDQLTPQTFNTIESIYKELIEMDANFLYAHTGLVSVNVLKGTIWGSLNPAEAKQNAIIHLENARKIDSESPSFHLVNGQVQFYLNYDFVNGESEFIKAMEGGDTWAPIVLSDLYIKKGEIDKSITVTKYLSEIDPINSALAVQEGCNLFYKGKIDEAIEVLEKAIKFNKGYPQYFRILAQVYLYSGANEKALEVIHNGFNELGYSPTFLLGLAAIANYNLGNMVEYEGSIKYLEQQYSKGKGSDAAFFLGQAYAGTQQIEKSLEWLILSAEGNEVELAWLKSDPAFKVLKGNPEYKKLLAFVNLKE